MMTDPGFYVFAIPAVILVGLSKGGLGGAIGILGVPLMALKISPVTAAAIMLPILVVMDMAGLMLYRRKFDLPLLKLMIPAATLGITIGYLTASYVAENVVRLVVGVVAVLFVLDYWFQSKNASARQPSSPKGWFWGTLAGFTSFVSHAGGPPFQVYAVPLQLDRLAYVGSAIILFSYINAAKLVPYFFLGQFNTENLMTSAVLLPLAPLSIWLGAKLARIIPQDLFYRVLYVLVFIVGNKLIWDGVSAYIGA